jgi:hypothetical protein
MIAEIREVIRLLVRERGEMSFAVLIQTTKETRGDCLGPRKPMQIVFWRGLSHEACGAIRQLTGAGELYLEPCSTSIYLRDGIALCLPIAHGLRVYQTPTWLPVVLCRGSVPRRPRHGWVAI